MNKVSIIIPLYNAEKYIIETLKSAINQTYENKEIIIIDDGSTDDSKRKIEKYIDNTVKYFYQKNSGVSVARNKGIEMATGDYITFLDSDDILHEDKVQKQMNVIKKWNYDVCYCTYNNWDFFENEKKIKKMKFISGNIIENYLNEDTIPQTGTWLIKKEIIKLNNIKFTPKCNWGEDIEFFTKVLFYSNCGYVEEALLDYRIEHTGSLSKSYKSTMKDIEMWERLKDWIKNQSDKFENRKFYCELIDRYRISRSYLDYTLILLKYNENINLDMDILSFIKFRLKKKDIKLYIKKIYILYKNKTMKNRGKKCE